MRTINHFPVLAVERVRSIKSGCRCMENGGRSGSEAERTVATIYARRRQGGHSGGGKNG